MSTQLTLIETLSVAADRIVHENQLIEEVQLILDRRLFTRGPALTSPDTVAAYLKLQLAQQEHEVFGVIFLDAQHRVLAFEVLFHGSIDGASVYPRQVVKRSLPSAKRCGRHFCSQPPLRLHGTQPGGPRLDRAAEGGLGLDRSTRTGSLYRR